VSCTQTHRLDIGDELRFELRLHRQEARQVACLLYSFLALKHLTVGTKISKSASWQQAANRTSGGGSADEDLEEEVSIRQHTSAYVREGAARARVRPAGGGANENPEEEGIQGQMYRETDKECGRSWISEIEKEEKGGDVTLWGGKHLEEGRQGQTDRAFGRRSCRSEKEKEGGEGGGVTLLR
jgi:hypothetical protein